MTHDPNNSAQHWDAVWEKEGLYTWREYPWVFGEMSKEVRENDRVLELGCGNGILAKRVQELREVALYDGFDISPVAIKQAQTRMRGDERYAFEADDLTSDFPLYNSMSEGFYDVALASEFLEHLKDEDLHRTLSMVSRVAKKLVIAVPNEVLGDHAEHHQCFDKLSLTNTLTKYYRWVDVIETEEYDLRNGIHLPVLLATCRHVKPIAPPKVLIAAPIGNLKDYSISIWLDVMMRQSWKDYDVAVCVNNRDKHELAEKFRQTKWVDVHGQEKAPIVLMLDDETDNGTTNQRFCGAREMLRVYAVDNRYDAIMWLDSDTIPPFPDFIRRLMAWDKPIASGLYHYKGSSQPVAFAIETETNLTREIAHDAATTNRLVHVGGVGFGCVLVRGEALAIPFDYWREQEVFSEDLSWCKEANRLGLKVLLDPFVSCKHLAPKHVVKEE